MAANSLRSQLSTIPTKPHFCFDLSDKTVVRVRNAVNRRETAVISVLNNNREIETIHFNYDYINYLLGFLAGKEHKIRITKRLHSHTISFHDIVSLLSIQIELENIESGSIDLTVEGVL